MKKHSLFSILAMVLCLCLALSACGNAASPETTVSESVMAENTAPLSASESGKAEVQIAVPGQSVDVDLTRLSSTMVYAEVYSMLTSPEDYMGKTVKMSGSFAVYQGENQNYYACLIADATACCSQGIEFVLEGDNSYPENYPEPGSIITVTGEFSTYREGDYQYATLIHADMETQ